MALVVEALRPKARTLLSLTQHGLRITPLLVISSDDLIGLADIGNAS